MSRFAAGNAGSPLVPVIWPGSDLPVPLLKIAADGSTMRS
jgi:hypothetical protein